MYSIEKFAAHSNRFWTLAGLALTIGMVTGFAIPMAWSYQSQKVYQPTVAQMPESAVLLIPTAASTAPEVTVVPLDRDSEMARLAARNRRLEALVATLRKKADTAAQQPDD